MVGLFAAEAAVAIERADLRSRLEGLNRTLRMQVEALRISDQLKTDFVSSVSHELRTPLASIIGYVDVMLDGDVGVFTDEQREFMGIVQQNARRLLTLINDLLTLSGVESGKMVLRRELTDLRGVVERCVRDQLQIAEASDLKLSLVLPADPVEAQVDADRIAQVVTNLLANAIKFTGAGGRVGVAVGRSRNGVALSVSDTGIGIGEDDQARLFERFFRARNAADNSIPGTGLGLAISQGHRRRPRRHPDGRERARRGHRDHRPASHRSRPPNAHHPPEGDLACPSLKPRPPACWSPTTSRTCCGWSSSGWSAKGTRC